MHILVKALDRYLEMKKDAHDVNRKKKVEEKFEKKKERSQAYDKYVIWNINLF
jgi:hypothetical protein